MRLPPALCVFKGVAIQPDEVVAVRSQSFGGIGYIDDISGTSVMLKGGQWVFLQDCTVEDVLTALEETGVKLYRTEEPT